MLKIVELEPGSAIQRELVLVKVRADNETRSQIVEIVQLFRAKTVDVSPEAVTIEATGSSEKLEAMLKMLEPYGIKELVQSGTIAIGRGARSITDRSLRWTVRPDRRGPTGPHGETHRPSPPRPTYCVGTR